MIVNKILNFIKQYPEEFCNVIKVRSQTTPSDINRRNHLLLVKYINSGAWNDVQQLISSTEYKHPFDVVIDCMNKYSGLEFDVCVDIYECWYGKINNNH